MAFKVFSRAIWVMGGTHLIFLWPSSRHERDRGYRASALHGMPVYSLAFAGIHSAYPKGWLK